ncbi:MAG TPA: HEAT repeat domain-containing protein [Holophagaceae bacterium]|nr:HEAT repeat domain-containing protein [Holophagaceae bacterium]
MPRFLDLAQTLTQALKALQMYQATHPRSEEALAAAKAALDSFLEAQSRLHLAVAGGKVFLDGVPQDDRSPQIDFLIRTFSERKVAGLLIDAGYSADELLGTLQTLLIKPQKIEAEGGFEGLLSARGVRSIRLSQVQYREISSEEASGEHATARSGPAPGLAAAQAGLPGAAMGGDGEVEAMAGFQDLLRSLTAPQGGLAGPGGPELAIAPASLGGLGGLASGLGLGLAAPPASFLSSLRSTLLALPPASQLSLMSGLGSLPPKPESLGIALHSLLPELLTSAVTTLIHQGYTWNQLEGPIQRILKPLEDRGAIASSLLGQLRALGLATETGGLESLLNRMDWDETPLEAKVARYLEGNRLLELGPDHRLALLRDLLDRRMDESFLRALEQLLAALDSDQAGVRRGAAETLAGVCRWALEPRLPAEAERLLRKGLPRPFINEQEPAIHRFLLEALLEMILVWLEHGELAQGTQAVEGLRVRMEQEAAQSPWKTQAMAALETGIRSPRGREAGVQALFRVDKDQLAEKVEPYLIYQGAPMAARLVERLETEQDRVWRGRIMDGLRAMGSLALPPLDTALKSDQWFLVRNVLGLLSDIGTAAQVPKVLPLLRHSEPRVSRSAVRAVWRLGGTAAENHLLSALKDAEYGTQLEILFALGQIKGRATAPALLALGSDRAMPERGRVKMLDALAGLATADQIPPLTELARKKGLFGSNAEPLPVRAAAIKALASIAAPEAAQAVKKILDAESKGSDRDTLSHAAGV